jgi:hypothetical protein
MSTSDAAQTYLQRQNIWRSLCGIFRDDRPDEARVDRIRTVAELAIDQVFAGLDVPADDRDRVHAQVHEYVGAASLYAYSLGRYDATQEGR